MTSAVNLPLFLILGPLEGQGVSKSRSGKQISESSPGGLLYVKAVRNWNQGYGNKS